MSTLRVTAKEFVPSWLASTNGTATKPTTEPADRAPAADDDTYDDSAEYYTSEPEDGAFWGDSQYQEIPMQDALALLACWFPTYSQQALQAIYEVNGMDLQYTLQDLCTLQAEGTRNQQTPPPPPPKPKPVVMTEEEFPALGPAAGKPAATTPQRPPTSFAAIVKANSGSAPAKPAAPVQPARSPPATAQRSAVAAGPKPEVPWLSTGDAVASEYANAREAARDMARVRNACFQQATMAYLAGNKALAKQLSERGRTLNERMKAEHEAASAAIFQSRNKALQDRSGLVDLHGLHAAEACRVLEGLLAQPPSTKRLLLCVGTGHHTKGSRTPARLVQAVEALLSRRQLSHRYLQPGLLEVRL